VSFALDASLDSGDFSISNLRLLPIGQNDDTDAVVVSAMSLRHTCTANTPCNQPLTISLPAGLGDLRLFRGIAFGLTGTASRSYEFQGYQDEDNGPETQAGRGATLPTQVGADPARFNPVCAGPPLP
jgi:spore coat protein U-like protein